MAVPTPKSVEGFKKYVFEDPTFEIEDMLPMKEAANAIINTDDDPMHGKSSERNPHIGLAMEMSFLDAKKRSRLPQARQPDNIKINMFTYQRP